MPRMARTSALVLGSLLCSLVWVTPAETQSKGRVGNADAITQDELKVYQYFLAADQLEGRNAPSRGYDTAALYVATPAQAVGAEARWQHDGHRWSAAAVLHAD